MQVFCLQTLLILGSDLYIQWQYTLQLLSWLFYAYYWLSIFIILPLTSSVLSSFPVAKMKYVNFFNSFLQCGWIHDNLRCITGWTCMITVTLISGLILKKSSSHEVICIFPWQYWHVFYFLIVLTLSWRRTISYRK